MKSTLMTLLMMTFTTAANAACFHLSGPQRPELDSICISTEGQVKLFAQGELKNQFQAASELVPQSKHCIRPSIENDKCFGWSVTPAYYFYSSHDLRGISLDMTVKTEAGEDPGGQLEFNGLKYKISL